MARVELRQWSGKREEEVFRWQNHTGSLYNTAPWSTKHTLSYMKMTPGVGEAGSSGGFRHNGVIQVSGLHSWVA